MRERGKVIEEWSNALDCYQLVLRTIQSNGSQCGQLLKTLDAVVHTHLPSVISSRSPPFINAKEYTYIVEWKLRRGKWRPQTLSFARKATNDDVEKASSKAFKELEKGNIGEAFDALLPLPGSSPSISSAILSVRDTSIPFMSHELLRSVQGKNTNYFRNSFLKLVEEVRAKARWLSGLELDRTWTSSDVEKAIFVEAHIAVPFQERQANGNIEMLDARQASEDPDQEGNHKLENSKSPSLDSGRLKKRVESTESVESTPIIRRRRRRAVKERRNGNKRIEVLVGPVDIEDFEEREEVLDGGSGASLYVPKSDQTEVNEDSDDERVPARVQLRPTRVSKTRSAHYRFRR